MSDHQDRNYVAGVEDAVPTERADSYMNMHSYAANCAERAVEEGHRAFLQQDASFKVISETDLSERYRVTYEAIGRAPWTIFFRCNCISGQNRDHLPIPCKHAWLAGRNLVNRGVAQVDGAQFAVSESWRPRPERLCAKCGIPLATDLPDGATCQTCTDVLRRLGLV